MSSKIPQESHPSLGQATAWRWRYFQSDKLLSSLQFSRSVMSDSFDPMNCSMPGLPVHHQLLELTDVCWVSDAIQPSHSLSSPSPPPSIFPSIRVFSDESVLPIRWSEYWSFSFNISPFNKYSAWFPLGWTGWSSLLSKELSSLLQHTVQKHQFFGAQLSL